MDFTQPQLLYLIFIIIPLLVLFGGYFIWKKMLFQKHLTTEFFFKLCLIIVQD